MSDLGFIAELTNDDLLSLAEAVNKERRRRAYLLYPQTMGRNARTAALNTLARHYITLEQADRMTDEELLELPNFGKSSLRYIRSRDDAT